MNNYNEKKNWKEKLAEYAPEIAVWTTISVVVVGYLGAYGYAVKKQAELIDEQNQRNHEFTMQQEEAKAEALARGAQVLDKGFGQGYYIIEQDGRVS